MNPKSDAWARAAHVIAPQSEKLDREAIVRSFVDMGHLQRLRNQTSQYVEGRRGTGKTHLLSYFCECINGNTATDREVAIFVDARTLKLESSPEESAPRHHAKVLYRELVLALMRGLESFAQTYLWQNEVPTARHPFELRQAKRSRECLAELEKLVTLGLARPSAAARKKEESDSSHSRSGGFEVGLSLPDPSRLVDAKASARAGVEEKSSRRAVVEQQFEYRLAYSEIGKKIEQYLEVNELERCYLVIDEWSSLPRSVQPHFAEAIKRSFFPSPRLVLKIGTLPFQTRFGALEDGAPIGFERNGDIFQGLDLDDELVFVKNPERSLANFRYLLHNHLSYALQKTGGADAQQLASPEAMADAFFTDKAFPRLLAYAHGNARDFLTLFRKAFLYFKDGGAEQISAPHVDRAAKDFALEKLDGIKENALAYACFNDIVGRVLHAQKSNGFLVDAELASNEVLLYLVHNRVLHVWDRSYSSPNHAGKRFLVLSIDFCILSDHLKAPNYRRIFEALPPPIGAARKPEAEKTGQKKLAALVAPDKRMVRYQVLPAAFFSRRESQKCPSCEGDFSPTHPVAKKHGLCPICGEPLKTAPPAAATSPAR
jgi:hypothetical protein